MPSPHDSVAQVRAVAERADRQALHAQSRRRARLFSLARRDGLPFDEALAVAARAELWLLGAMDPEEVVAQDRSAERCREAADVRAPSHPALLRLLAAVARVSGVPAETLLSDRRAAAVARPRQVLCYLAARHTTLSYPQIGQGLRRDHTTVMYARRRVAALLAAGDPLTVDLVVAAHGALGLDLPSDLPEAARGRQAGPPAAPVSGS